MQQATKPCNRRRSHATGNAAMQQATQQCSRRRSHATGDEAMQQATQPCNRRRTTVTRAATASGHVPQPVCSPPVRARVREVGVERRWIECTERSERCRAVLRRDIPAAVNHTLCTLRTLMQLGCRAMPPHAQCVRGAVPEGCHICPGTPPVLHPCHICTETGLTPALPAPRLG
jgi:hypothetical protein